MADQLDQLAAGLESAAKVSGTVHQQADWQRHVQREGAKVVRRMAWLHRADAMDADGYEWGVYRVKWEDGRAVDVQRTRADFTDMDAAIAGVPASGTLDLSDVPVPQENSWRRPTREGYEALIADTQAAEDAAGGVLAAGGASSVIASGEAQPDPCKHCGESTPWVGLCDRMGDLCGKAAAREHASGVNAAADRLLAHMQKLPLAPGVEHDDAELQPWPSGVALPRGSQK